MKNWKTTLSGIALLAGGVALAFTGNLPLAGISVTAAIGLLAAKDHNS